MKRLVLLFLLWGISLSVASESESMACRATNLLRSGKFVKSYSQFEQALLASRKESDLQAEGRILIAMAQIRTQSLEFEFAGQLLSQVRKAALDSNGRVALLLAQISLLNAQNKYEEAVRLWTTEARAKYRNVPDLLLGSLYGEVAITYAGYGDKQQSQARIETAEDYFSGMLREN
jgi:DNA-binding transcriptional regulator/RsmH inhibitor MraZ